jgi:hypothetical protein
MGIKMKPFLIILIFVIFTTGCADKNAFSKFKMNEAQELSASSLQSSKVKTKDGKIKGIFSAIYLNEVYPKEYFGDEYFYIYMYLKEKGEGYNLDKIQSSRLKLKLNSKTPIEVKQLPHKNRFSDLTGIENEWNLYYLVTFKKERVKKLSIVLESDQFSSDLLVYQKDKQ